MSWKAEVVADNSGRWIGNHMCFATKEEAEAYLRDLKSRWKAVRNTRVVESDQRVNYRVVNGRRCQSRTQTKCPLWLQSGNQPGSAYALSELTDWHKTRGCNIQSRVRFS